MSVAEDIELCFIRIFSVAGNRIGKTVSRAERRERVRQAIYVMGLSDDAFHGYDATMTYAEAFRLCFGERLDRRAATRSDPEDEDDAVP